MPNSLASAHNYAADRIRLEASLDDRAIDPMFRFGQHQGAIDFCTFLRGKIDAVTLLREWENFATTRGYV